VINLHILEIDQAGKLVLHYEKESNAWWFGSFFEELEGFEAIDLGDTVDYVCQRMPENLPTLQKNFQTTKHYFLFHSAGPTFQPGQSPVCVN
jgi:hypothetical protein